MPNAPIEAKEAKEAEEAMGEMINTAEMEEIWGPSIIAMPQLNRLPSSPLVQTWSPKHGASSRTRFEGALSRTRPTRPE